MTIPLKYEDVVAKLASVTDELGRLKRVRSAFINRVLGERDAAEGREAALREDLEMVRKAVPNSTLELVSLQQRLTVAEQRNSVLEAALKFYADGDHLLLADADAWDTCSGEPVNFLHDEAGTASVEDGSIAKAALKPAAEGEGS